MSNIIKRMARKARKRDTTRHRPQRHERPKLYTDFNIFTHDGQNLRVKSEKPMTLEEAMYKYKALSISGNE